MNHTTKASANSGRKVCDLAATLTRMGSNVELARQILELFREDAPGYQVRLHEAIAKRDSGEVEKAAHSLRGMLSTFGADAAIEIALQLERAGSQGDLAMASAQICELDNEISRFLETVTAELGTL
jgi:HPt (histidine-containing phosphotransfer) domain-containing protein